MNVSAEKPKELSLVTRACAWGALGAGLGFGLFQLWGAPALLACILAEAAGAGVLEVRRGGSFARAALLAILVLVAGVLALFAITVVVVATFGL